MLALGLFWFGVAVAVIGFLILFRHAFEENRIWGIAGILLVVPLIVHIFLAWDSLSVRKGAYGLIIGVVALLVSISGGALENLPFLPENEVVNTLEETIAPPKETPLPNEEEAKAASNDDDYDPLLTGSEFENVDVEKIVPPSKADIAPASAPRYQEVPVDTLISFVNRPVRVTMQNGELLQGTLTHVGDNAVIIESLVEGGSLGLSHKREDIRTIAIRLAPGEQVVDVTVPQESDEKQAEEKQSTLEQEYLQETVEVPPISEDHRNFSTEQQQSQMEQVQESKNSVSNDTMTEASNNEQ